MKTKIYLICLLIISVIPLVDLLHSGLPVTHDGQDHIARIANFYKNLQEGIFIPRWAGNLNWGYGHPILMFLYPLPSYTASLFHLIGLSLVDSVKLVFGISFVLSGITMYLWVKNAWSKEAGFIAAILYLFAPYRFVDLYVRGAIGEHIAFIFPPLVLYFFYKLSKELRFKYVALGSFSLAGFILAHNAISLMFMPIILLYALYLAFSTKNRMKFFICFTLLILFGYGLSSFFWVPAFFEGKYTLRDIVTKNEYASRFVQIKDLLYGQWNYGGTGEFTVQLGIPQWLAFLGVFFTLFTNKKRKNIFLIGLFILFFSTLFLMTVYAKPIWEIVTTLQKFQFPWRLLSITVFITSVFGAILLQNVQKKYQNIFMIVFLLLTVFFTKNYWYANGFAQKPEGFYTGIYNGTTDTGESAPIWSVRFMEKRPVGEIEILEGKGVIKNLERKSTKHVYLVQAISKARIKENTLYFPGWEVRIDEKKVPIEFQDRNYHGIMTFFVPSGTHEVIIEFKETKLRKIANSLSVVSLVILAGYSILKAFLWQRFRLF